MFDEDLPQVKCDDNCWEAQLCGRLRQEILSLKQNSINIKTPTHLKEKQNPI